MHANDGLNNRAARICDCVQPHINLNSILASVPRQVLSRREQLGLRKRKKDVNKLAKAKKPAPKEKLKRKKSGLCKLRKSKRALKSVACGSADPMPEGDADAWWSRADHWVWDDGLNNYVKIEKGEGYLSVQTPEDHDDAAKKVKTKRRVTGKALEAEPGRAASSPKPKAKAKSKAKASPKASPKGAAKAKAKAKSKSKPAAEASPKASPKGVAKAGKQGGRRPRPSTVAAYDVEERDVERISDWVRESNLTGSLDDFKVSVRPFLPDNSFGYRCNIYWTTAKCGVTLRFTDESGEKKQTDIVTYGFGKTRLAAAVAISCACSVAVWLH